MLSILQRFSTSFLAVMDWTTTNTVMCGVGSEVIIRHTHTHNMRVECAKPNAKPPLPFDEIPFYEGSFYNDTLVKGL